MMPNVSRTELDLLILGLKRHWFATPRVGLSDSILCAADSYFGDDSDAQVASNATMEMTIDTLKSAGGFLDCQIADQATTDLMDTCENKFQPDGAIYAALDDESCSFYKVLPAEEGGDTTDASTCEEYCQQQGGTCLFSGDFGKTTIRQNLIRQGSRTLLQLDTALYVCSKFIQEILFLVEQQQQQQ